MRNNNAPLKFALLALAGIVFTALGGFAIVAGMTVKTALSGVVLAAWGLANFHFAFRVFN